MLWWARKEDDLVAYPAVAVGRHVLKLAREQGFRVTAMKLMEMVYSAHGWRLAFHGLPLVRGEPEAGRWGPVFRELYRAVRKMGGKPLELSDLPTVTMPDFEPDAEWRMADAVQKYGPCTVAELSELTHLPGSPWSLSRKHGHRRIPDELTQFYYRQMLEMHREREAASA